MEHRVKAGLGVDRLSIERSSVALLLIDVINDLDFPEADQLLNSAILMAQHLVAFKHRAAAAGVPSVYVNDNFGRWQSDFKAQVEYCGRPESKGRELAKLLAPGPDDYFVLKPKHSGFYSTTLEVLLESLGVRAVILSGIASNICVLFTANDAYMRGLKVLVPSDCVAANTEADNRNALEQMARVVKADIRSSEQIDFDELLSG